MLRRWWGAGEIRDRKDAEGGYRDNLLVATELDGYSGSIYLSSSSTMYDPRWHACGAMVVASQLWLRHNCGFRLIPPFGLTVAH